MATSIMLITIMSALLLGNARTSAEVALDCFVKADVDGWYPSCSQNIWGQYTFEQCAQACLDYGDECGGFAYPHLCYIFTKPLDELSQCSFSTMSGSVNLSYKYDRAADCGEATTLNPTKGPTQSPSKLPSVESTDAPTTADPTDACYGVQCVDLFTCDAESDQFETVTDYPCKRDCDLFGIDEYLDQCSAIFPSAIEAVTASIGEVNEIVQRITDSDIPAVTARVQINEDAVTDINDELSTMHLLVGELSNVDAAMNESIADLVTDINEDLSSVISLISALSDVDTTLNNSIAAVTVLAESALIALEERVAFLEVRLENFGASSAAKTANEHMYAAGDSIALSGSLFAKYKDEILGALVTANFFVMVACACMISSRNNKKFKYVSVVGDEEAGTENE